MWNRLPALEIWFFKTSDSVRDYFIKYQDRILYGTDFGTSGNEQEMSG